MWHEWSTLKKLIWLKKQAAAPSGNNKVGTAKAGTAKAG